MPFFAASLRGLEKLFTAQSTTKGSHKQVFFSGPATKRGKGGG